MKDNRLNIGLTRDEALVLFGFLRRLNENEDNSPFEDQAEQRVLWNIECMLEKELPGPFHENYIQILELARENVGDNESE